MSIEAMSAVFASALDRRLKTVALALAWHADAEGRSIYPTVATVARMTSIDARSVQRHLRALRGLGVLIPEDGPPRGGAQRGTCYRLALGVLAALDASSPCRRSGPATPDTADVGRRAAFPQTPDTHDVGADRPSGQGPTTLLALTHDARDVDPCQGCHPIRPDPGTDPGTGAPAQPAGAALCSQATTAQEPVPLETSGEARRLLMARIADLKAAYAAQPMLPGRRRRHGGAG